MCEFLDEFYSSTVFSQGVFLFLYGAAALGHNHLTECFITTARTPVTGRFRE